MRVIRLIPFCNRTGLFSWQSRPAGSNHVRFEESLSSANTTTRHCQYCLTFLEINSPILVYDGAINFNGFYEARGQTLYWKLPSQFLGNKITSYGGNLRYKFRFSGSGQMNTEPDVIIHVRLTLFCSYYPYFKLLGQWYHAQLQVATDDSC